MGVVAAPLAKAAKPAPAPAPAPASAAPKPTPAEAAGDTSSTSSESGLTGWVINDKRAIHAENQLSVMADIGFSGTFNVGVGAWYAIPVVQHGFIPSLNNSFDVEFGGFFQYYNNPNYGLSESWFRISPMVGGRWNFYLTPEWTVFACIKLGYGIGFGESDNYGGYAGLSGTSSFLIDTTAGALWHFNKSMALRMDIGDIGDSFGIAAGITLPM